MTKVNSESAQKLIGMLCEVEFDDGTVEFEVVDTFDFNDNTYALMMELEDIEDMLDGGDEDEVEGNGYLMIVNEDLTLSPVEGDGEFFAAAEYYQVMHLDGHDDEDEDEEDEEEYDGYSDVEGFLGEDEDEDED